MIDLLELARSFGFPVAVAGFVLIRLNGKMERLTIAMTRLADRLEAFMGSEHARRG